MEKIIVIVFRHRAGRAKASKIVIPYSAFPI